MSRIPARAAAPERLVVVDDDRFDAHRSAGRHPERPERLEAARDGLRAALGPSLIQPLPASAIEAEQLERVHDPGYVRALDRALRGGRGHLDADTYFCPATREAAWVAAGGAWALGRAVGVGEARRGLGLLRPPGHHASRDRAMGFCLLNHAAIAAASALGAGLDRVAVVDWDVHHGNGTEAIFWEDPRVLYASIHEHPQYPGTGLPEDVGAGGGLGRTGNVGLSAGAGPEAYGHAFREIVLPLVRAHAPELLVVSAGFDGHARDPIGGHALDAACYAAMAGALVETATALGHGRVLVLLEGGYDLRALEDSIAAVASVLSSGVGPDLPACAPRAVDVERVARTRAALRRAWPEAGL